MSAGPSGQASISYGAAQGSAAERAPAPEDWEGRERRLNILVFEYWDSLLKGRDFPSVADLDPSALEPFRDYSLLIDFTEGYDNPRLRFIGKALRQESGIEQSELEPDRVPRGTMLSRLTDHYLEILANRAPIGFEAEFTSARGVVMLYRGILLPLSDDGETINFIYGAVSWKEAGAAIDQDDDILDLEAAAMTDADTDANDGDGDDDALLELTDSLGDPEPLPLAQDDIATAAPPAPPRSDDSPWDLDALVAEIDAALGDVRPSRPPAAAAPPSAADLRSRLDACRTAAAQLAQIDSRSRGALYETLGQAYDFFQASDDDPAGFADLLREAGINMQARAPFTPVVKLIFGKGYDKTRVTEYAACLSYAAREAVPAGGFGGFIESFEGGIKACVKAERAARRAERGNQALSQLEQAVEVLRARPALAPLSLPAQADDGEGEFVLLLARRGADGQLAVIEKLEDSTTAMESWIKRAARRTGDSDD
ncbi:MAG: hypothetical protein Tsb0016_09760 [Sphingomonadales bacterium]